MGVVGDDDRARPETTLDQAQDQIFMQEALPSASEETRAMAGELITTTLSQVWKHFSESPQTAAEIEAYADALADMFCAYLETLRKG